MWRDTGKPKGELSRLVACSIFGVTHYLPWCGPFTASQCGRECLTCPWIEDDRIETPGAIHCTPVSFDQAVVDSRAVVGTRTNLERPGHPPQNYSYPSVISMPYRQSSASITRDSAAGRATLRPNGNLRPIAELAGSTFAAQVRLAYL